MPHESCEGGYSVQARRFTDEWYGKVPFDPVSYGSQPLLKESPDLRAAVTRKILRSDELVKQGHDRENYYTRGGRIPLESAVDIEVSRMFEIYRNQRSHQLSQLDVDALVEAGRLHDFTHDFVQGEGWIPKVPAVHPTAEQVNAWSMSGIGHDSCNQWVCVKARCQREGVPETCGVCKGSGEKWTSRFAKRQSEAWQPVDPPSGDCYQIWETVSEGSPISPVFATPEELARHMETTRWGADEGTSYERWMKFITGPGWAPSGVSDPVHGFRDGV